VLEKQFEELKLTGILPSPHGVGLALLQITQKSEASIDEVVAVLQADPTLTGRILKLANSALLAVSQPATTAREAAMRLGLRAVRNVSLGFSLLAGNRSGRCAAFDYEDYWTHSLATAVGCQLVAERSGGVEPSEAFTCGLLSGIGRLALASVHGEAYARVLERARGQGSARLAEIESEVLGAHHRELAAAMLRDWKLPRAYSDAVALVGSGQSADELTDPAAARLARVLQGARVLARAMSAPSDADAATCRARLSELAELSRRLGLDATGFASLWQRCVEEWKRWGDTMKVRAELQFSLDELRRRAVDGAPGARTQPTPLSDTALVRQAAASARGLRVLLVGTDAMATRLLSVHLAREGHAVETAAHGEQALAKALEHAPHVLVTDWNLPGISGLELVRTLRQSELGARVHVILLAAREEERRILEAFDDGVDEVLMRPCEPRILRARVRAAQRVVALNEHVAALLREREAQLGQLTIASRKLQSAAVTDALTGLHNRRYALELLERDLPKALEQGRSLALIMIDIDRFKAVNDRFGHDVGDRVLRAVADVLRGGVRRADVVCRLGGEEFLVICPDTALAGAAQLAERLRCLCAEQVIETGGFDGSVTLSLGVAELEPGCAGVDALLKRADERVYLAKQAGRDRVVAADAPAAARRRVG
jgi:two-component system cell cycle response regulator